MKYIILKGIKLNYEYNEIETHKYIILKIQNSLQDDKNSQFKIQRLIHNFSKVQIPIA